MAINFPDSPTTGQIFTSGSTSWIYDGIKWGLNTNIAVSNDSMPVGAILWYANTSTAPLGWIAADGSAVSRTTYATLFTVIGTTYGSGDGSTTFNVPSVAATTGKYYIRYTTSLGTVTTTSLSTSPVGTMLDWPTTSSYPTGYLRADGSAVSRTSYADLFALIGTTYGVGDNSTTFNLPNLVAAGSGSPVKIIKASLGGIVEPSTIAHASSHTQGGSDVVSVTLNQIPSYQSYRNLLYNGANQIHQKVALGTGVTGISSGGVYHTSDRWVTSLSSLGTWTQSVENDAPTGSGLRKSLKMLCTAADASPAAGDYGIISQRLEGQDLQRIAKGTVSAKGLTLSFWVKSNVTGMFIASLEDSDNTRFVSQSYTVAVSGTWEQKTLYFPADATGALDNDANTSLTLHLWLGAGSSYTSGTLQTTWAANGFTNANNVAGQTNLASATSNYWQVTGVQLEIGLVSTPFEFEPYETTLKKCQRYFVAAGFVAGNVFAQGTIDTATNGRGFMLHTPTSMRQTPTITEVGALKLRRHANLVEYDVTGIFGENYNPNNNALSFSVNTATGPGVSDILMGLYCPLASAGAYINAEL